LNIRHEREFVYDSLKGKTPSVEELKSLEFIADISIIINQIGQHVKHHYGEKGYLRLLDHVNASRLNKELKNNFRPKEF